MTARTACVVAFLLAADAAHARNVLAGPLFGLRLGGPPGSRGLIGIEAGAGIGPERINVGFEGGGRIPVVYLELAPWYLVGLSLGMARELGSRGRAAHFVMGVWEGFPLRLAGCEAPWPRDNYEFAMSIGFGYRYSGIHELYITPKAGVSQPFCFE